MIRYKKIIRGCTLSLLCAMMLSGCGKGKKEDAYSQALLYMESENYTEAEGSFQSCIAEGEKLSKKQKLQNQQALHGLGVAAFRQADYEKAKSYFEEAITISAQKELTLASKQYIAQILALEGNYEEAYAVISEVRKENPKEFSAIFQEYQLLLSMNNESAATELLNDSLEINGMGMEYKFNRAKVFYYLGNVSRAEDSFMEALEKGYTESNLYLGLIAEERGELEEAVSYYQLYLEMPEADAGFVYYRMARMKENEGDIDGALAIYKTARETGKGTLLREMLYNEISLLEEKREFKEAYKRCREYRKQYGKEDAAIEKEWTFLKSRVKKQK